MNKGRPQHHHYHKHNNTTKTYNEIVNRENNYKINVNRVRNYFITPTQGPLKLSYENPKGYSQQLQSDFIVASPIGKKAYCWIHNDMLTNKICTDFIPLGDPMPTHKIEPDIIPLELVYGGIEGTIFYGTYVHGTGGGGTGATSAVFIIEDIFYFQGKYVSYATWKEKMVLYKHIFTTYTTLFPTFSLPFMCHSIDELHTAINKRTIGYKVQCVQYKRWDSKKTCVYETVANVLQHKPRPPPLQTAVSTNTNTRTNTNTSTRTSTNTTAFWTKADTEADIYYLYNTANVSNSTKPVGMALIPNYKTSVKMNQLFRNIKENARLDALEESDDEEEFENTADNKFLLNKEPIQLQYLWHPKFRKYYPLT